MQVVMGLEMKQSQSLHMKQEMRLTPQLQQAIRLLQLSRLELVEAIEEAMAENPLLEEAPDDEPTKWDEADNAMMPESDAGAESLDGQKAVEEIDWDAYVENLSSPLPGSTVSAGDELPGIEQTSPGPDNLVDHLIGQLADMNLQPGERELAEALIYNLDEQGYLRDFDMDLEAAALGVSPEALEDALVLVQELDPAGIGARDLSECLQIQARRRYPYDDILLAIVRDHLEDLEKRNYNGLARRFEVTREDIMHLHRRIQTFDPRPGRQFSDSEPTYVVPDITIEKRDGEWVCRLNHEGLPRLRVSGYYRDAMRRAGQRDAREFIVERLRSAQWLIRSIEQREQTIMKVTRAIIWFQEEFLDKGIDFLRPLVLRDIADHIGMHESTISRVTTNKYVHTPQGVFELKFFFNSSIRKRGGDDVAAEAVKHRIRALIAEEDPTRPLSDQQLADKLSAEYQIEIARRTVAKYREMLNILPSSRRRSLL
jgi:RNA polymerase sigma-54 factor